MLSTITKTNFATKQLENNFKLYINLQININDKIRYNIIVFFIFTQIIQRSLLYFRYNHDFTARY